MKIRRVITIFNIIKEWFKININFFNKKIKKENFEFKHIHHTSSKKINEMYEKHSPIFVLSTGRTGTKFLTNLLNESNNIQAYHEPRPGLQYFCNYAFHNQNQSETLTKMFDGARNELILETYIKNKKYVETNQCMTFFAPYISKLFEKSKFVHLVRHPGDFVRSGIRKGWYKNDSLWEEGRIKASDKDKWEQFDVISKLAWDWYATNQFIEDLKNNISNKRFLTIKSENMFSKVNEVSQLLDFIGGDNINDNKIQKIQNKPINKMKIKFEPENMHKTEEYPKYKNWHEKDKNKLIKQVDNLPKKYGYKL